MAPYPGEFPDIEEADRQAQVLALLKAAGYGAQPEPMPQMAPSPGVRLGPLRVGGGTLDNLSAAALRGLNQGGPQPTSGGGRFAQGFIQGFAGHRAGGAQARQQQFEAASEAASEKNKAAQRFRENAAMEVQRARRGEIQADAQDRRQTERLEAAEERRRMAAAAQAERDEANFVRRQQIQEQRFQGQAKLMQARNQLPESPAKQKALSLSLQRMALNDPDVKDFIVIRDYYNNGLQSLKSKDSFGDLTAMRALARVTDPRTGIREEEFRTFERAVGELQRIGMLAPRMIGAGTLTEAGRAAVARELGVPYNNKKTQYEAARAHYQGEAEMFGVDPKTVLRDLDPRPDGAAGKKNVSEGYN